MTKMSKKILTIFLSLFLVGVLSVSCSNADKTGSGETTKGIEQYNGNNYVSTSTVSANQYLWVLIKDGKIDMITDADNNTAPTYGEGIDFSVTGSTSTDYDFSSADGSIAGSLRFASDGSILVVRFTKNPEASESILNSDITCNKK